MRRKMKLTLVQELAWALFLAAKDSDKGGFKYGYGSTVMKALRRYKKDTGQPASLADY